MLRLVHIVWFILPQLILGQTEIGLRFGSYLHSFSDRNEDLLVNGQFTTGVLGVNMYQYFEKSRLEYGLNIIHKGTSDALFPNLPLIMQDFGDAKDINMTAIEAHIKAGPSFDVFFPYVGYAVGYRLSVDNFQNNNQRRVNRIYFSLPMGFSFNFPTNFGSVGFGGAYYVGLTNVLAKVGEESGTGRLQVVGFELTVSYGDKPRLLQKKKAR